MQERSPGCEQAGRLALLEREVVGALIWGDTTSGRLGMTAEEFTDPLCRRLFALCADMESRGVPVDFAGVCMEDEALDAGEVHAIVSGRCLSESFIERNLNMLREAAMERAFRAALHTELASEDGVPERVQRLTQRLAAITRQGSAQECPGENMLGLMSQVLSEIDGEKAAPEPVATGIEKLDRCLCGGYRPGDLVVVAALTSVGKSAMLAFMMRNAARAGKRALLVSCEMSAVQNAERYIASTSGVPLQEIISRSPLSEEQNIRVCDGISAYHPENIQVLASGTLTPQSVRRAALRMQACGGLDLIVVDYLQRLRSDRAGGTRAEEIGSIAAALKALAVDLDVPVLTAAQFNREAARSRSEFKGCERQGVPALHQLRDSSQIEDEANTVIVLDEPARQYGAVRSINAHVVKNRSGDLGVVRLIFDGQTMRYTDASQEAAS